MASAIAFLGAIGAPIDALEREDAVFDLAHALTSVCDKAVTASRSIVDYRTAETVRSLLHAEPSRVVRLEERERLSGRDRWGLSRDSRMLLGTSPYRYLLMRRLEAVKVHLRAGVSRAEAALAAGFADQSHMSRHFKRTYDLSPGRWLKMLAR